MFFFFSNIFFPQQICFSFFSRGREVRILKWRRRREERDIYIYMGKEANAGECYT